MFPTGLCVEHASVWGDGGNREDKEPDSALLAAWHLAGGAFLLNFTYGFFFVLLCS